MTNWHYLIEELYDHRSPDAEAMAKYQRNQFPFIGIKSQARRAIAKPYLTEAKKEARTQYKLDPQVEIIDWDFVAEFWAMPEREFQYIVCDYLKEMKVYLKKADLPRLEELITSKSWWDSVDALVKTLGYLVHQYDDLKLVMIEWSQSDNIWLRRTSMIHQLGMKDKTDVALLETTCMNCFGTSEFFINKGMGWILRDYAKTNQRWVKGFLLAHSGDISNLTWRESTKHFYLERPDA